MHTKFQTRTFEEQMIEGFLWFGKYRIRLSISLLIFELLNNEDKAPSKRR